MKSEVVRWKDPPFIFLSFSLVVLRLTQASHTPPTGGVWAFYEKNRYQIRFLELPLILFFLFGSIQGQGGSVNSEVDLRIKNWKGRSRSWELPFGFQIHHVQFILGSEGKPLFERCRRESKWKPHKTRKLEYTKKTQSEHKWSPRSQIGVPEAA